jgi:hypothetical protein
VATEIGVWQIIDEKLKPVDISLAESGDMEKDFEKWIKECPQVLGRDILIIGEQTQTKSGPLDFLGIDKSGNLVIIELKRGNLPRDVLAQAIDYVSDVASWDLDKINETCLKFTGESLENNIIDNFDDIDLESININETQRILLVGFSLDEALERMIEWLSDNYNLSINALIFKFIKTQSNDKLIARTMIIPEQVEKERIKKSGNKINISDEPGDYEEDILEELLINYLKEPRKTPQRIKHILLPLCLEYTIVTRDMIKEKLIQDETENVSDEGKAGLVLTTISREIGIADRDYLRQIIRYDRPNPWEKENYRLVDDYRELVKKLI